MDNNYLANIEKAIVTVNKHGQGVLVNNNMILTAAHCVECNCKGGMALGDVIVCEICSGQNSLKAMVLAADPVSDIAVLGSLDNQISYNEANAYENFCESMPSVPLCIRDYAVFEEIDIHIYSHKNTWLAGKGVICREGASCLFIEPGEPVEGGTSGGPIVNDYGELIGIVSQATRPGTQLNTQGMGARPNLALPVWAFNAIQAVD